MYSPVGAGVIGVEPIGEGDGEGEEVAMPVGVGEASVGEGDAATVGEGIGVGVVMFSSGEADGFWKKIKTNTETIKIATSKMEIKAKTLRCFIICTNSC